MSYMHFTPRVATSYKRNLWRAFKEEVAEVIGVNLQEDGTLGDLLADTASLENILDLLCGVTRKKEGDAAVRNSLAESVEMLVS